MQEPSDRLPPIGDFTARLLTRHGALVEAEGSDIVAVVPPPIASTLDLPEYGRLAFDPRMRTPAALTVDYDSPLVDRFGALVERLARVAAVPDPPVSLKRVDAQTVSDRLNVANGVVRELSIASVRTRYVGFFIEYELLADERVSGTVDVWVNTSARTVPSLAGLMQLLPVVDVTPPAADGLADVVAGAWRLGSVLARHAVAERLQSTIESLGRRRERDFARLREYYGSIDDEIRRRARRAFTKGDLAAANTEVSRLEATAHAFRSRIVELVDRYRARVRVRPLGALACVLPIHRVTARLLRRSASRMVTLAWNPVDRGLEPPACDGCGAGVTTIILCDAQVHLLCPACHGECETCGRPYCRACSRRCPRRHE